MLLLVWQPTGWWHLSGLFVRHRCGAFSRPARRFGREMALEERVDAALASRRILVSDEHGVDAFRILQPGPEPAHGRVVCWKLHQYLGPGATDEHHGGVAFGYGHADSKGVERGHPTG